MKLMLPKKRNTCLKGAYLHKAEMSVLLIIRTCYLLPHKEATTTHCTEYL